MRRFAQFASLGAFGLALSCASLGPAITPDDEPIAAVEHAAVVPFAAPIADADPSSPHARTSSPRERTLVAGGFHACVLQRDATVACWGRNDFGQLGNGSRTDTRTAIEIPDLDDVAQIGAGQEVRCLWGPAGAECWGGNDFDGCRGDGRDDPAKCVTAELANVIDFDLAVSLACAVIDDGSVRCFGTASHGQTPTGGHACYANYPEPGCPRALVGLAPAIQVAVGSRHACALHDDGAMSCWGTNNFGQTGTPLAKTEELRWRDVVGPTLVHDWADVVEIDAGRGFTCARMRDGSVACIGDLAEGRMTRPLLAPHPL